MALEDIVKNNPTNLRFIPNSELTELEKKAAAAHNIQVSVPISALARHIHNTYESNRRFREQSGVDRAMLNSLHQRNSEYPQDKLAAITEHGGSRVFIGLTNVKCRAAESWVHDVLGSDREKSWELEPTPMPDLGEDTQQAIVSEVMAQMTAMMQEQGAEAVTPQDAYNMARELRESVEERVNDEAKDRSERMETTIHDQLVEGGWTDAFDDLVTDIVTLKAGILKLPVLRTRKVLRYRKNAQGKMRPVVQSVLRKDTERVSPFDIYPSKGMVDVDEGDLCERMKLSRKELQAMKGVPNYNDAAINLVLARFENGMFQSWNYLDQLRAILEKQDQTGAERQTDVEAIEYSGNVSGMTLIQEGIFNDDRGNRIRASELYDVNAIKVGQYLIYIAFNPDPLGRKPYSKTGWGVIPGSFWYHGVPELMLDLQSICNAAVRSLVNNMGISSGPQVIIEDINRLASGQTITKMRPWKIWQFVNRMNSQLKAIDFFQPDSNASELMGVYDKFSQLADDFTGIPAYTYGNDRVAGAGRTASGLSMLMSSAARGIKKVISRIDQDIIRTSVTRMYDWNMLHNPDESIKGDVQIRAHGALALIIREQMAAQRMEFLTATANEYDQQIMGPERRANVLREAAAALQMGEEEAVPGKREMKQKAAAMEAEAQAVRQQEMAAQLTQ